MKAKLADLTDAEFDAWVEKMTMEGERRGIVIKGTAPVYEKNMGGPVLTALLKVQRKVWELNRNAVHKTRDLELTTSESSNFSTLRQAGLIAQVTDEEGKDCRGFWLITKKGGQFL